MRNITLHTAYVHKIAVRRQLRAQQQMKISKNFAGEDISSENRRLRSTTWEALPDEAEILSELGPQK